MHGPPQESATAGVKDRWILATSARAKGIRTSPPAGACTICRRGWSRATKHKFGLVRGEHPKGVLPQAEFLHDRTPGRSARGRGP